MRLRAGFLLWQVDGRLDFKDRDILIGLFVVSADELHFVKLCIYGVDHIVDEVAQFSLKVDVEISVFLAISSQSEKSVY